MSVVVLLVVRWLNIVRPFVSFVRGAGIRAFQLPMAIGDSSQLNSPLKSLSQVNSNKSSRATCDSKQARSEMSSSWLLDGERIETGMQERGREGGRGAGCLNRGLRIED